MKLKIFATVFFLLGELSSRTKDKMVSYGELLSSQIIAINLKAKALKWNGKTAVS